jgi:hypothetical protein
MKLKPRFPEHCHLTHFCVQTRFTFSFNPKFVRFQACSNWATWHGLQNEVPMAKQWAMQGSSKWHPSRKAKCHLAPLDMLRNQYLCLVVPMLQIVRFEMFEHVWHMFDHIQIDSQITKICFWHFFTCSCIECGCSLAIQHWHCQLDEYYRVLLGVHPPKRVMLGMWAKK